MAKKKKKTILRKGKEAVEAALAGDYINLKDGDKVSLASFVDMDEMISFDQHVIWIDGGSSPMFPCRKAVGECPGCEYGDKPRFRAVLPVLLLPDKEPKIFAFGITIERALEELDEEWGELAGHLFSVKRTGTGLNTRYAVVGSGKEIDLDDYEPLDILEAVGPEDLLGQTKLMVEAQLIDEDALDELEEEEEPKPKKKRKVKRKAKKKAGKVEDDDDDWEEV